MSTSIDYAFKEGLYFKEFLWKGAKEIFIMRHDKCYNFDKMKLTNQDALL